MKSNMSVSHLDIARMSLVDAVESSEMYHARDFATMSKAAAIEYVRSANHSELKEFCEAKGLSLHNERTQEKLRLWLLSGLQHSFTMDDLKQDVVKRQWTWATHRTTRKPLKYVAWKTAFIIQYLDKPFALKWAKSANMFDIDKETTDAHAPKHKKPKKKKPRPESSDTATPRPTKRSRTGLPTAIPMKGVQELHIPAAKLGFAVDVVDATWNGARVHALCEKGTTNLVRWSMTELVFTTLDDPAAKLLVDSAMQICLTKNEIKEVDHFNRECKGWEADAFDYDDDRRRNEAYHKENDEALMKQYGKGAWVVVARGRLIAVCQTPAAAMAVFDRIPTAVTSVKCLGYGTKIIADVLCTTMGGVVDGLKSHPTITVRVDTPDKKFVREDAFIVDTGCIPSVYMESQYAAAKKYPLAEFTQHEGQTKQLQFRLADTPCDDQKCTFDGRIHTTRATVGARFTNNYRVVGFPILRNYALTFNDDAKCSVRFQQRA